MIKKARNYTSAILDELMAQITPEEFEKTKKRMLLAVKIEEAMKAKGIRKIDLAKKMNKRPSIITRWLSGTNNFETDTLFELEEILGVNFINIEEKPVRQVIHYHLSIEQKISSSEYSNRNKASNTAITLANWISNNQASC